MALTAHQQNIRVQIIAVVVGIVLLAAKFAAYYLTHSNAILTDALESIINVVAGVVALMSLYLAALPRDQNHPYGHGKVEFLSAGFEGTLIALAGAVIAAKSIYNFFHPHELHQLDVGLGLTAVAGAINYAVGAVMVRNGRNTNSITLIAGGKHLQSDAYSSLGLVIGLIIIYFTQQIWLDNVVALVFGGIIVYTGLQIVRHSVAGIMDELDYELSANIIKILDEHRSMNWVDIHNLRIVKYGAHLHIDCHLTIPWFMSVRDGHEQSEKVARLIAEKVDSSVEFFIHLDPCLPPDACQICIKRDCLLRQHPLQKRIAWELDNVLRNSRHGVETMQH
ncbi:MAG: cation transporter [Chitinophagales bacterium]|jgi:cation diffusion facilitator family transporter|nr:cation transporter [Chitinophagales bacterium]